MELGTVGRRILTKSKQSKGRSAQQPFADSSHRFFFHLLGELLYLLSILGWALVPCVMYEKRKDK
jgi:hypothetical protein